MTRDDRIVEQLREAVGRRHVRTDARATNPFTRGYRFGHGGCLTVVQPGTLVEMWRAPKACVRCDVVVILQAANTGLTGGSTPYGDYDRPVIVLSTLRLAGVRVIRGGTLDRGALQGAGSTQRLQSGCGKAGEAERLGGLMAADGRGQSMRLLELVRSDIP